MSRPGLRETRTSAAALLLTWVLLGAVVLLAGAMILTTLGALLHAALGLH